MIRREEIYPQYSVRGFKYLLSRFNSIVSFRRYRLDFEMNILLGKTFKIKELNDSFFADFDYIIR